MKSTDQEQSRSSSFLAREATLRAFARQQHRRSGVRAEPSAAGVAPPRVLENTPPDRVILAPGTRVGEHYEVGPIIGAGPLGIVYKARHVELGQLVALEVIRPDRARSASAWQRFEREARALGALHDKHVVRVHDSGTLDSGLRYLVMELLEGCTLRVLLASGPVEPRRAAGFGVQMCSALSAAHRANIIHRDIRPENVFLAKYRAAEPSIKLLGFGSALFLDDGQHYTVTRRDCARPDYLAPEQLQEPSVVDTRSDIWAVGMTLYELVAGRTPFFGLNVAQTCLQIARGDIPRVEAICPETICPLVAGGIGVVIHRCLQLDPAQRYASVDELALALEPFAERRAAGTAAASAEEPSAVPFPLSPATERLPAVRS
jgi:serine/threonine protein kinase